MGYIGDVDFEEPAAGFCFGDEDGVVMILGVEGIDGDDEFFTVVVAAGDFFLGDFIGDGAGLAQDVFGE